MEFNTHIEDIDFDGAQIESITRKGNSIKLVFNNCILFARHPNSAEYKRTRNGLTITFMNVCNESSKKYIGNGISEPYCGEKPLDTIEVLNNEGSYFEFGGYVKGEPWYQWSFNAEMYKGSF